MAGKLYLNGTYAARIYFDYETAVGKAEIDRRDILLCKLILSFSPVNHQCKFPTSHCELSKLRCVWVFLIQLISEWVPLGFLKYRFFFGDFTTILFTSKLLLFVFAGELFWNLLVREGSMGLALTLSLTPTLIAYSLKSSLLRRSSMYFQSFLSLSLRQP